MEQQRSIFVTVVAWIFIVFSALALLEFVMFGFIPFSTLFPGQMPPAPINPIPRSSPPSCAASCSSAR